MKQPKSKSPGAFSKFVFQSWSTAARGEPSAEIVQQFVNLHLYSVSVFLCNIVNILFYVYNIVCQFYSGNIKTTNIFDKDIFICIHLSQYTVN